MYPNKKTETACKGIMIGTGVGALSSVLLILVRLFGRKFGAGEMFAMILANLVSIGAFALYGYVAWYGVRRKTGEYFRNACFVNGAALVLHFFSYAMIFMKSQGMMVMIYMVEGMLLHLLGAIFLAYVAVDAKDVFYNLRNDRVICIVCMGAAVLLDILLLISAFSSTRPYNILEVLLLLLVIPVRFGAPGVFVVFSDRLKDPYPDEEAEVVLAELRKKREEARAAEKAEKEAEKQRRKNAALERKKESEERKKADERRREQKELAEREAADAKRAAEKDAARRAAEERQRIEEERRRLAEATKRKAMEERRAAEEQRMVKALEAKALEQAMREAEALVATQNGSVATESVSEKITPVGGKPKGAEPTILTEEDTLPFDPAEIGELDMENMNILTVTVAEAEEIIAKKRRLAEMTRTVAQKQAAEARAAGEEADRVAFVASRNLSMQEAADEARADAELQKARAEKALQEAEEAEKALKEAEKALQEVRIVEEARKAWEAEKARKQSEIDEAERKAREAREAEEAKRAAEAAEKARIEREAREAEEARKAENARILAVAEQKAAAAEVAIRLAEEAKRAAERAILEAKEAEEVARKIVAETNP